MKSPLGACALGNASLDIMFLEVVLDMLFCFSLHGEKKPNSASLSDWYSNSGESIA